MAHAGPLALRCTYVELRGCHVTLVAKSASASVELQELDAGFFFYAAQIHKPLSQEFLKYVKLSYNECQESVTGKENPPCDTGN